MFPARPSPARATIYDKQLLHHALDSAEPMLLESDLPAPAYGSVASAPLTRSVVLAPLLGDDGPSRATEAHNIELGAGAASVGLAAEDTALPPGFLDSPPSVNPNDNTFAPLGAWEALSSSRRQAEPPRARPALQRLCLKLVPRTRRCRRGFLTRLLTTAPDTSSTWSHRSRSSLTT